MKAHVNKVIEDLGLKGAKLVIENADHTGLLYPRKKVDARTKINKKAQKDQIEIQVNGNSGLNVSSHTARRLTHEVVTQRNVSKSTRCH